MRTLTIIFATAFAFLLSQQLTAASPGLDQENGGASQAVVGGAIVCESYPPAVSLAGLDIEGGIGVFAIPTLGSFGTTTQHAEDCSDLASALAEQVPHSICEVGNPHESGGNRLRANFVCTGRADVVISAVGTMAKALIRLGQP
jgi:hypothetical protein